MEINKILNPKGWLIGLGALVLLLSVGGVMDPESVAEMSWGEDAEITDEILAYESMWALHMIPFGILAITTGLVVKGEELAKLARQHNNANILSLPARFISIKETKDIVDHFLKTKFEEGRHKRRVDKIPCP